MTANLNLIRADLKNRINYDVQPALGLTRLHLNELPWAALNIRDNLNQYPDNELQIAVKEQLAERYQVRVSQLLLTRGSDEAIDLIMRLFLNPNQDCILQCPPTFSMYAFFALLNQGAILNCPLDETNFTLDLVKLKQIWQPNCKLIMLCTPNNPSGNLIGLDLINVLCDLYYGKSMIVVDEAYIEFSGQASATTLLNQFDNLIILRTLSKAYGLAGLRLGAIITSSSLIEALKSIMAPFSLSNLVLTKALQVLVKKDWPTKPVKQIIAAREWLFARLKTLNWVDSVYPSAANFLLIRTSFAPILYAALLKEGIAVRHFTEAQLSDCLRITLGTMKQNRQLWQVLKQFQPAEVRVC